MKTGMYIPITRPEQEIVCTSKTECENLSPIIEYGKLYEITVELKEPVNTSDIATRLADAILQVRRRWPGVSINYIEISDDGKQIRMQIFDPRPQFGAQTIPVAVIVYAACFIAVLIAMKVTGFMDVLFEVAKSIRITVEAMFGTPEKPDENASIWDKILYYMKQFAIPVGIIGISTYLVIKAIKE